MQLYQSLFGLKVKPLDADMAQFSILIRSGSTGNFQELVPAVKTEQLSKRELESLSIEQHARNANKKVKMYQLRFLEELNARK